jgi:RimJ/RimL family protein N-acetyltransferase
MDQTAIRLHAPATASAPALELRPWRPEDAPELVVLHRDEVLRRWIQSVVDGEAEAVRWVRAQERGWREGDRFAFAVVEAGQRHGRNGDPAADGPLVGHAVLKRPEPGGPAAEVGYWTAGQARGRGVAPRALDALTTWAFTTFAADGLVRLELLHSAENFASCRVARKCGYPLTALRPAAPPRFPLDAHLHTRLLPT